MPEQYEEELTEERQKEIFTNNLVSIAKKQIDACLAFKKPRMVEIAKNEDLYNNRVKKALKGRWNIPLPIMSGFIDTLMAKTDDQVMIKFGYKDKADMKRAMKVSAAWEYESSAQAGNWDKKDRACKKQAGLTGLGIYKFYSESDPKYSSCLEIPDIYDFIFEPSGGNELEKHLFCGEKNIFKTKQQLIDGVKNGYYDPVQTRRLFSANTNAVDMKQSEDAYQEKTNRFRALGLDVESNNYVGQPIFSLNEHYIVHNGQRYYLLFDYKSGLWLRCKPLKEVFESELWPYVTWQSYEDAYNLLTKAPADDIRPVAEAMKELFNQMLENVEQRNHQQRIIDPDMFADLTEFNWRPRGLIKLKSGVSGKSISDGVYEFKVDDNSSVVVNIFSFLENYLGQKTGITQSAQGTSEQDKKVGIYFGEMQQVADRIGLQNKAYTEAQTQLGLRYYWGLKEHLSEEMMVRIIGSKGAEWDKLRQEDLKWSQDPDIYVSGGNLQSQTDALMADKKASALTDIAGNQLLVQQLNPKWLIEKRLLSGGWEEEDIKRAMDTDIFGDELSLSEAEQMVQDVMSGKEVEINRGATMAFCQALLDASGKKEIKPDQAKQLQNLTVKHLPIAQENEKRRISQMIMAKSMASMGQNMPAGAMKQPGMAQSATLGAGMATTPQGATTQGI